MTGIAIGILLILLLLAAKKAEQALLDHTLNESECRIYYPAHEDR